MGWEGIGTLLGKVSQQFRGRIERLKNEKANLEKERDDIQSKPLDINNAEDRKKSVRLAAIYDRIEYLNRVLANKASD